MPVGAGVRIAASDGATRTHHSSGVVRVRPLSESIDVHLEGEDLTKTGLAPDPPLMVTMELEPVHA